MPTWDGMVVLHKMWKENENLSVRVQGTNCLFLRTVIFNVPLLIWTVWRRKWKPTPVFLPGKFHWQRGLVGYKSMGLQRVGHDWACMHNLNSKMFFLLLMQCLIFYLAKQKTDNSTQHTDLYILLKIYWAVKFLVLGSLGLQEMLKNSNKQNKIRKEKNTSW